MNASRMLTVEQEQERLALTLEELLRLGAPRQSYAPIRAVAEVQLDEWEWALELYQGEFRD